MRPYEYYTTSPYEWFCISEGYFDKIDTLAQMFRMASIRIHQSLVSKPLPPEKFWPLWSDKKQAKQDRVIMTKEVKEQIMKAHNIKMN